MKTPPASYLECMATTFFYNSNKNSLNKTCRSSWSVTVSHHYKTESHTCATTTMLTCPKKANHKRIKNGRLWQLLFFRSKVVSHICFKNLICYRTVNFISCISFFLTTVKKLLLFVADYIVFSSEFTNF